MSDGFTIPELTKGLRVLGSPRVLGGPIERFLAPLIDARRAAERAQRWQDRLGAFDGDRIEATLRAVTETTASELHPDSAPDRRALAARLGDAFSPVIAALRRADDAAAQVRAAGDDDRRRLAWSEWVRRLAAMFTLADLAAEDAGAVLGGDMRGQFPDVAIGRPSRQVKSS